jgi:cytochrome P450
MFFNLFTRFKPRLTAYGRQVVMKEAMRLHPGVSYPLERLVPEGGTELCGQKLREGTNVGINPVVVHQSREIYGDDAAQFRPERWLEADQEQLKIMERTLLTVSLTICS